MIYNDVIMRIVALRATYSQKPIDKPINKSIDKPINILFLLEIRT